MPRGKENRAAKYLSFQPVMRPGKKTYTWDVWAFKASIVGEVLVGQVRWWGAWRKYVFFPGENTFYDSDGLQMIADYCTDKTREHYEHLKEIKAAQKGGI